MNHRGVSSAMLALLWIALATPAAAQRPVDASPGDVVALPRPGELQVCPGSGVASAQEWQQNADAVLREVRDDCTGRVSEADGAVCRVSTYDVVQFVKERGDDCLLPPAEVRAAARYVIGDRLLQRGALKEAELLLYRAQQALPDDAPVLRRWNDALGEQLYRLALDQPMTDLYARDILLLSTAAQRFYPDDEDLQQRRAWAEWAVGAERVGAEFERCRQAVRGRDWRTAEEACETVQRIEPGHLEVVPMLELIEDGQAQQRRARELARTASLLAALALLLVLFVAFQGDLFYALGQRRFALAAYDYLAGLFPSWRKPALRAAAIHRDEGDVQAEREALRRAETRWPRDPEVLQRLFEHASRVADMRGVRDSILRLAVAGELTADQVVRLLDAQRVLGLVEDDLVAELEERVAARDDTPLLPLLALAYDQRRDYGDRAREVYERTLALADTRLRFLVPMARVELAADRAGNAIEYAEQAVAEHPTAEAVECLTDALLETDLQEHMVWASPPAGSPLLLYPALLKVAERSPDLAPMIVDRMKEFYEGTADADVAVVTASIVELLEDRDPREQLLTAADSVDESVPYLKAVEAAFEEYARRNPRDGMLWLRLSEIHHKLGRHTLAYAALDRAFHIADTRSFASRRSAALVHELDALEVVELLATQLGLESRPLQQTADGVMELMFYGPRRPLHGWWTELDGARVRIYSGRPPTPEDVLALRRSLEEHRGGGPTLAVLVSTGRPSVGTNELIMTTMIEAPRLHLLPLDERTLRDAVTEFRGRGTLAQLRSQWLLGEDLFDKKDPVLDPAEFFGRGQVLRTLVRKVHRGEVFGLFGVRKMGKTSLAHRLRSHLADAVVAMVDLQEISSSSCVSLAQLLGERALEDWREKFPDLEPPELEPVEGAERPMVAFERNLRTLRAAVLATERIATLFFLVDEVENLIPHDLDGGAFHQGFEHYDAFFRLLRGLHQTDFRDVFSFAVIGANARLCLQGKWGGLDNPIFQYLSEFYVGPLSPAETAEMISTLGGGMGLTFTDAALARLYEHSGGHPMVCRQLCSETAKVAGEQRPATIDTAAVREAADRYLSLKKGYFGEVVTSYLSAGQRAILDAVAADGDGSITRAELLRATERHFADAEAFDRELQSLGQYTLLLRRGDRYRFPMHLLRTYIRVHRLDLEEGA